MTKMTKPEGFADLRTPHDLLGKLEYDRKRMGENIADTYAAFDFFLTAEHLVDWLIPDRPDEFQRERRDDFRNNHDLLKIVSDVASGAKHFQALDRRHDSVEQLDMMGGFDPRSWSRGSWSSGSFQFAGLNIKLTNGNVVHVLELADDVLAFWEKTLGEA